MPLYRDAQKINFQKMLIFWKIAKNRCFRISLFLEKIAKNHRFLKSLFSSKNAKNGHFRISLFLAKNAENRCFQFSTYTYDLLRIGLNSNLVRTRTMCKNRQGKAATSFLVRIRIIRTRTIFRTGNFLSFFAQNGNFGFLSFFFQKMRFWWPVGKIAQKNDISFFWRYSHRHRNGPPWPHVGPWWPPLAAGPPARPGPAPGQSWASPRPARGQGTQGERGGRGATPPPLQQILSPGERNDKH